MTNEIDLTGWTVLFDLDGTLVDSAADLVGTVNRMLARRGMTELPLEPVSRLVGRGALPMLREGFAEAGMAWDEAASLALLSEFVETYRPRLAEFTRPYPGAVETLAALRARGARLAIATNKRTDLSLDLTDALGLTVMVDAVIGPDRVSARKPSGAHLIEAVQAVGGDPTRAVMVGDSQSDSLAAQDAGMPLVLVTFGYTEIPVSDLGADVLIDSYAGFMKAITPLVSSGRRAINPQTA